MSASLTLVAGANGAGKSTFMSGLPFGVALNPDTLARGLWLYKFLPSCANLRAIRSVERAVISSIRPRTSVTVETVLSTLKYCRHVVAAQQAGMQFWLIYVALSSDDLAVVRVRERVQAGGHDVPETKIRGRWQRSLDNFRWFAERADVLLVFLNDTREPELLAWGDRRQVTLAHDTLPRHGQTPIVQRLLTLPNLRTRP